MFLYLYLFCSYLYLYIGIRITFGDHSPLVETIQGFASKQRPNLEQGDPVWRRFDTQDGSFACAAMI